MRANILSPAGCPPRVAAGLCTLAAALTMGLTTAAAGDNSVRSRIEADWRRQDQRRMAQIRLPGLVRFVETELSWPGLNRDDRVPVPKIAPPKLDGRLDDPCWERAAEVRPRAPDAPALRLGYDRQTFYAGLSLPSRAEAKYRGTPTALDAGGAVDGVKDGKYGFHTGGQPNPWWQVDLGTRRPIARIVVYNRLDYQPGLHNADNLIALTSDDGKSWTQRYDNRGRHFGGVGVGKPLTIDFGSRPPQQGVHARFVRLQVRSPAPVFFHLDEVEIYAGGDPNENVALQRPARQSSLSQWSRGWENRSGALLSFGESQLCLVGGDSGGVTLDGELLPPQRAQVRRQDGRTEVEVALPLSESPGRFPAEVRPGGGDPVRLAAAGNWQVVRPALHPAGGKPGFGKNCFRLTLNAAEALDSPVELAVETVVFTARRPQRRTVFRRELAVPGAVDAEFQIEHEGAVAVIVTARQGNVERRHELALFVEPVQETLHRAERLLADFGIEAPKALAAIRGRAESLAARERAEGPHSQARAELYRQARWLAREIAFGNPRLDFDRLFLVRRFSQETYPDVCLNHMPWVSRPGGDLCIVSLGRHDEEASVDNLIGGRLGPGHVHGADLWWDADRVVFGYAQAKSDRPPEGWLDRRTNFELRRTEEPTHLFEIGVDGGGLRQLTSGQWSDLDPTYLASGDVAFASERCACSLQCNEYDKDETSCNLYVMHGDGSHIRQLSVSKDGDYLPHALDDGTIAYTRWEYQERLWANIQSIWTIRPDGTGADALFKQHMNDPWALEDARSIPDSKKLVAIATGHHTLAAGPVVIIDPHGGLNNPAGIRIVTPGVSPPEGGMAGTPVDEGGVPGSGGHYMTPWPLSEKSMLVSFTYGSQNDPAGYAVYLIDVYGTQELVYRDPEISCFTPIPLRPRPRPPICPDATDRSKDYAVCTLQEVGYGVPGVAAEAIRYVRISKRDQWPYCNRYGGQRYEPDVKQVMVNWTPARVIGTVPVEADGSACFRVPADVPVYFQLLDENHMELRRMRSFISFQPGEVRGCVGCHETRAEAPAAGRFPLAMLREPRIPIPPPWGDRAVSFLRDVQPVLNKHCLRCHGGLKPEAKLDFSAGLTANYNRAYDTIFARRLVARSNVGDDARVTPPLAFGSRRSKLIEVLRGKEHRERVDLGRDDWLRLVTWIDANGPYHDGFINKRPEQVPYDLPGDGELIAKIAAVHARRCVGCHQAAEVTRADWIDVQRPRQSLFLAAPLAKPSGGTGGCPEAVYADRSDPDYRVLLGLVEAAVAAAWDRPRRDLKALVQQ